MIDIASSAVVELNTTETGQVSGGSQLGYVVGYVLGAAFRLIADADPLDGNYYGVGA